MGGARERFGGSGIIVLADDRRLAAESTRNRCLATLEGIDHIHLKEGRIATTQLADKEGKENGQMKDSRQVFREA